MFLELEIVLHQFTVNYKRVTISLLSEFTYLLAILSSKRTAMTFFPFINEFPLFHSVLTNLSPREGDSFKYFCLKHWSQENRIWPLNRIFVKMDNCLVKTEQLLNQLYSIVNTFTTAVASRDELDICLRGHFFWTSEEVDWVISNIPGIEWPLSR